MRTPENIKQLVCQELGKITNSIVKKGLESILISEHTAHLRAWDYSKTDESFECWTIAIDHETDTSIIFSDYGHVGWGLVSTKGLYFGMDSGWFRELQACYLESFAAGELPIWCVKKEIENNGRITLTEKMNMDSAFEERDKLAKKDELGRYHVAHSELNLNKN